MIRLQGNVLITGGTGSLGKALLARARKDSWDAAITVFSRSESLQAEIRARYPMVRFVLGDVRNAKEVHAAIAGHDIVIHAAAMKRVPEAESQVLAVMSANVEGSANVLNSSIAHGVKHLIGISTDKAVNATTVYGASKLAMERMFQGAASGRTEVKCVRYGNVVASRGSVIPIWEMQARSGLPLTITDENMSRFWLSVEDAVDLVLEAFVMYRGTVLVPLLPALKVVEVAQALFPNSAHKIIGTRSVERMHELLLGCDEEFERVGPERVLICPPGVPGTRGEEYSSATAPRLPEGKFAEYLGIARSYE